MASVSTNKLGSLTEQSVEEPTSGAPKLEAMVEVKFKVRQLAVLLKAEENVVQQQQQSMTLSVGGSRSTTATTTLTKTTIVTTTSSTTATSTTTTTVDNVKSECGSSSSYSGGSGGGGGGSGSGGGVASASRLNSGIKQSIAARSTTAVTATAVEVFASAVVMMMVQKVHHEARQIKVEQSAEETALELGQKIERSCLKNEAVKQKSAENEEVHQINNENYEFPVHDWGVPENFVVELPKMTKFEQHLSEARRLESALVLVKPTTKLLAFQQISRERIFVDVIDETKSRKESSKKLNLKKITTTNQIDANAEEGEIPVSVESSNLTLIHNKENILEVETEEDEKETNTSSVEREYRGITITEVPESCEETTIIKKNCEDGIQVEVEEEVANRPIIEEFNEEEFPDSYNLKTKSFQDFKREMVKAVTPQKFEKTLTAALDLALLGQSKFQLKWKRSEEFRKSALKYYAKAQLNFEGKKWSLQDHHHTIIESTIQRQSPLSSLKAFTKWETSESLQLLKSKKKASNKLSIDENFELVEQPNKEGLEIINPKEFEMDEFICKAESEQAAKILTKVQDPTIHGNTNTNPSPFEVEKQENNQSESSINSKVNENSYDETCVDVEEPQAFDNTTKDNIGSIKTSSNFDARERISTFFDLKILEDNLSLSGESETDYLSETKSSPEALLTVYSENGTKIPESEVIKVRGGGSNADHMKNESEKANGENNFKVQLQAASIKPVITHDRFFVKLLEDLSSTEDDINEQEVELLYIRKAPFIEEEDEENYEELRLPEKSITTAGATSSKYLMGLLEKKTSSEDDLIEIDAESDDWDEELDPEIDRIEFFDSEDHDFVEENTDGDGELKDDERSVPQMVEISNETNSGTIQNGQQQIDESGLESEGVFGGRTKVMFGNITEEELLDKNQKPTIKITTTTPEKKDLQLINLPRFRVVPNTEESTGKFPNYIHDDERPSCSKFRNTLPTTTTTETLTTSTWYAQNFTKKIPPMCFENENMNYQSELQSVLKKIRLLSEIDELDQSCVYEEPDTEQRLYMRNGEWFATEPSESDEEIRNEKRITLDKELQSLSDIESPRALMNEHISSKRFWMLSELRKRFGLRTAKYDPTKKRPGMIIDSENWEEAYSEDTFWNAHKNSFEKVRVLAKKGRFKFAIISEAKRTRKVETSDEGEESDKSSSEDDEADGEENGDDDDDEYNEGGGNEGGGKSLRRKHSSFEIRQTNYKRNDDGEVFFQPINGRGAMIGGDSSNNNNKCSERRWALPPSRIYRFSRSFGRILKLHMKRPDLETILEECEPNDDGEIEENDNDDYVNDDEEESNIEIGCGNEICDIEDDDRDEAVEGVEEELTNVKDRNLALEIEVENKLKFVNLKAAGGILEISRENNEIKKKFYYGDDMATTSYVYNSTKNPPPPYISKSITCNDAEELIVDWYYCFYNDHSDEPIDEDYFGDLSDFE